MELQYRGKSKENEGMKLEDALDKVGTGYFQYKLAIIGGICILSSYLANGVIAFILPAAQCDLKMNSEEKGRLASASFLGLILSCHLWGFLSDTLGRKYILIRCLFCDGLLYLITMLINNNYVMLILRVFNGIASCGGIVSIYAYIGEFQTDAFRPRALMISSLVASCAYILLPVTAWSTIPAKWEFELYPGLVWKSWRLYYILNGIPSLLGSILLYFLPESPKFLLAKGKTTQVIDVLERMHKENNNKDELSIKTIKVNEKEKVGKLAEDKSKIVAFFHLVWDQTVPLLKKPHGKNFALIAISLFCVFFCNNGLYIWLPESLNRMETYRSDTGIDEGRYCEVVEYQSNKSSNINNKETLSNIKDINLNFTLLNNGEDINLNGNCKDNVDVSVYLNLTILGSLQFSSWVILVIIIKYCNRKILLTILTFLTLAAISSFKISNLFIMVPVKADILIICTGAIFPILNGLVVELFPTNLRAMAGCLALMASRLGTLTTTIVSGLLIDSHCEILLWSLITPMAVCLVTVLLIPVNSSTTTEEKTINDERV